MIKIYNTLTKSVQEFKPVKTNSVGIYVCGPTVYAPSHLGHARTWVFFDWLRRYFLYKGYQVKFVQNITDVGHLLQDAEEGEDKIEKIAKSEGKTPEEIARFFEKSYFEDLRALNILKPDESPRATEYIEDIINFIKVLIEKDYAYEVNGNVYFDISKYPDYGKLSGRDVKDLIVGTRIKEDQGKKNPADFVLWLRASKEHLQKWPSPWGEGYPGWHIECSVMSQKLLGQPFDIHGSASEHVFPHHENEIAQSWGYAQKPSANYFLHSGMLLIDGKKMSKSVGNYITIQDALKDYSADTIKLAFMGTFWRKPFNWLVPRSSSEVGEKSAIEEAKKLENRLVRAKMAAQPVDTGFPTLLEQALDDDFNVPKALAVIYENLNKMSRHDFEILEKIFGLELKEELKLSEKHEEMIKEREIAREKGDFRKADAIRKTLEKKGIIIEDTPSGTRILSLNKPKG